MRILFNELETNIIECLESNTVYKLCNGIPKQEIDGDRECYLSGFITNITASEASRCDPVLDREVWSGLSGVLAGNTTVGFLVFIERGFLHAIEGYTFGDPWPRDMRGIKLVVDGQT